MADHPERNPAALAAHPRPWAVITPQPVTTARRLSSIGLGFGLIWMGGAEKAADVEPTRFPDTITDRFWERSVIGLRY